MHSYRYRDCRTGTVRVVSMIGERCVSYSVLEPSLNDLSKIVNPPSTSGMASPSDLATFRASNSLWISSNCICYHVSTFFLFQSYSNPFREEGIFNTALGWHWTKTWLSHHGIIGWRFRLYHCMRLRNDDRCLCGVVWWFHMINVEKIVVIVNFLRRQAIFFRVSANRKIVDWN